MKNRTIIGIICVVASLIICFAVVPFLSWMSQETIVIARAVKDIAKGEQITTNDYELVKVGSYNIPSNVITQSISGLYASCDIKADDYFLPSKLTTQASGAEYILSALKGDKVAISVNITSLAGGLSGKLRNGDIISIMVLDKGTASIPMELTYLKIITTTSSQGIDADKAVASDKFIQPTTITFVVTKDQALVLAKSDISATLHAVFIYRGDEAIADEFIKKQDEMLRAVYGGETEISDKTININDELQEDIIDETNDDIGGDDN